MCLTKEAVNTGREKGSDDEEEANRGDRKEEENTENEGLKAKINWEKELRSKTAAKGGG